MKNPNLFKGWGHKNSIFHDDTTQYLFDCCQPGGAAMNKPPSRRKKVIPAVSGEPKPATDSAPENTSGQDNPASATITVTAVEILELTEEEQSLRLHLEPDTCFSRLSKSLLISYSSRFLWVFDQASKKPRVTLASLLSAKPLPKNAPISVESSPPAKSDKLRKAMKGISLA